MKCKFLQPLKIVLSLLVIFLALSSCSESEMLGKQNVPQDQITNIRAESSTGGTIRVSWTPSTNADAVSSYRIVTTNTDTGETHVVDVPASEVTMENDRAVVDVAARDGSWSVKVVVINNDDTFEEAQPAEETVEIIEWQATPPSIVSGVVANASPISIVLSWNAPSSPGTDAQNGQASITKYAVFFAAGNSLSVDTTPLASTTNTTITFTELTASREYAFIIQAVNSAGQMSMTQIDTITTPSEESFYLNAVEVQNITATSSTTASTIEVSWMEPFPGKNIDGTLAYITSYTVYYGIVAQENDPFSITMASNPITLSEQDLSVTISNLELDSWYAIIVQAENSSFDTSESVVQYSKTPVASDSKVAAPGPVTSLMAEADASTPSTVLNLQWSAPTAFGANAEGVSQNFSAYKIYYSASGPPDVSGIEQHRITDVSTTSHVISDLTKGTTYDIAVVVENDNTDNLAYSQSSPTRTTSATLDLSMAPGAVDPASIVKTLSDQTIGQITFLWAAPTPGKDANGLDENITYFVYYAEAGQYTVSELINLGTSVETTETTLTLQNLNGGIEYDIAIVGANSTNLSISSEPSITSLPSNGVKSIAIQENGLTVTSITKAPTDNITLSVFIVVENVTDGVIWSASPSENVIITESSSNPKEIQVSSRLAGTTTITATSVADASVQAEVNLTVNKVDMGTYNLNYGASPITIGQGNILPVVETTIPTDMNLEYIITSIPDSTGISIVNDTGEIIITADPGMYSITVEVGSFDPFHTGTTSSNFDIEVISSVSYKADTDPNAQGYFSAGDVNNSYLFVVETTDPLNTTGILEIHSADGLQTYYNNTAITVAPTGIDGVFGLGPDENDPVNFAQLGNNLKLLLSVYKENIGTFQVERIVSKAVPETIDSITYTPLYSWRDLTLLTSGNYLVKNDINFPMVGQYGFSKYAPGFSSYANAYTGIFDGGGFTIDYLYINDTTQANATIFGNVVSSTIKNITIGPSSSISGNNIAGGLAGYVENTIIDNVAVHATIHNLNGLVGGIAGYIYGNCLVRGYATGDISSEGIDVGGLVGYAYGAIVTGYYTGNITAPSNVGGLVGTANTVTINGYSTGTISAQDRLGGLIGDGANRDGIINGYTRAKIIVLNAQANPQYIGRTVGKDGSVDNPNLVIDTYYSSTENIVVDETDTAFTNILGVTGTSVQISTATQSTFANFVFGTDLGRWVWTDGQWPAINIGNVAPVDSQPTN